HHHLSELHRGGLLEGALERGSDRGAGSCHDDSFGFAVMSHEVLFSSGEVGQPRVNGSRVSPLSSTHTAMVSVKSLMASIPCARPIPIAPIPPIGTCCDIAR